MCQFYRFFSYLKWTESEKTSGFKVFILNAEQNKNKTNKQTSTNFSVFVCVFETRYLLKVGLGLSVYLRITGSFSLHFQTFEIAGVCQHTCSVQRRGLNPGLFAC